MGCAGYAWRPVCGKEGGGGRRCEGKRGVYLTAKETVGQAGKAQRRGVGRGKV